MAKKETLINEEPAGKLVSARVHCEICKGRFITNVKMIALDEKKTQTKCKVCEANEIVSFLIFDRKY